MKIGLRRDFPLINAGKKTVMKASGSFYIFVTGKHTDGNNNTRSGADETKANAFSQHRNAECSILYELIGSSENSLLEYFHQFYNFINFISARLIQFINSSTSSISSMQP